MDIDQIFFQASIEQYLNMHPNPLEPLTTIMEHGLPATIWQLRQGKIIEVEGRKFQMINTAIQPGDLYIGERNDGPKILTANKIDEVAGTVVPITGYSFDFRECVKVTEIFT